MPMAGAPTAASLLPRPRSRGLWRWLYLSPACTCSRFAATALNRSPSNVLLSNFELCRHGAPPSIRQGARNDNVPHFDQQVATVGVSNFLPVLKLSHDNSGVDLVAVGKRADLHLRVQGRSEEHTSELQSRQYLV